MVSLLLIGIAAWGIGFGLISSLRVVGVVIAVGIFLFLIALVGLIGAVKHHQVLLFFYMIILLLVFIVQFSVSCVCLALNQEQQAQLLEVGWNNTASARDDIQRNLNCCGFRSFNPNDTCLAVSTKYKVFLETYCIQMGFPGSSPGKESVCNAGDPGSIPRSGRSPGEGIDYPLQYSWASLMAQLVKNLPAMWETWVRSLGWEDPLEKGTATHSDILAWRIP